jgi:SAM-dependent methyltransferase
MAEIPSLPQRAFILPEQKRAAMAAAYQHGAKSYDRIRPPYPQAALDFTLEGPVKQVADIGCGSGIFTEQLASRGVEVWAVDPSQDMLEVLNSRLPCAHTVLAPGEQTGLAESSVDVVSYAQAWHWVDPEQASAEAARLLREEGRLVLLWNQLDVSVPWVHRLTRIMHAGDVHRPELIPPFGPQFAAPESGIWHWSMALTLQEVIELTRSRSYYRRANEATRNKVETNLRWYWCEHLGHDAAERVDVPYLTHAWRARKRRGR